MDIESVKKVAELVSSLNLESIEVDDGTMKIKVVGHKSTTVDVPSAGSINAMKIDGNDRGVDFNNLEIVTSPMVGVFYGASSPDADPYVKVGDKVKKGDVLCIIEAMKLMNEIVAENDGEIVDICVSNGDVVEYGQTLFKIF